MNWHAILGHIEDVIVATFGTGGVFLVFAAIWRHWCTWPPTPEKIWNWIGLSGQELVSQKGAAPQNPTEPQSKK